MQHLTFGIARKICRKHTGLSNKSEPTQSQASHHPNCVKHNWSDVTYDTSTGFGSM